MGNFLKRYFMLTLLGSQMALADQATDLGMKFVRIPSGTFTMGVIRYATDGYDPVTVHRATITRDYFMQTTDVTQEQWSIVMGYNPSTFANGSICGDEYKLDHGVGRCPNHPVEQVSWNEIQKFIEKLNDNHEGIKYQLPTEAQWEFAARAGDTEGFPPYSQLDSIQWYSQNSNQRTHQVGTLRPNGFGLYDMLGNVWQWTADYYNSYDNNDVIDPVGPSTGTKHAYRGGSYDCAAIWCGYTTRNPGGPKEHYDSLGFRLIRSSPQN